MIETLTRPKAERGPHPYGVMPPYLRVPDFLPYWPAGRTALYQAIQKGRFYSFIIRDELNKSGVRVIDVESAFGYLRSLAEKAKKQASGPNAEQTPAPGTKATPQTVAANRRRTAPWLKERETPNNERQRP